MINDKQMKSGDCEFLFSGNTIACKWMENQSMLLLSSALEWMTDWNIINSEERKGFKDQFFGSLF